MFCAKDANELVVVAELVSALAWQTYNEFGLGINFAPNKTALLLVLRGRGAIEHRQKIWICLLYTSDAADDM
eukprot:49327-Alexandrium_andersonii.AAC.1